MRGTRGWERGHTPPAWLGRGWGAPRAGRAVLTSSPSRRARVQSVEERAEGQPTGLLSMAQHP